MLVSQCGSPPPDTIKAKAKQDAPVWRTLGSWSGHGNTQTESFSSDTGALRVRWETTDEQPPDAGTFRLIVNSAISGRSLLVAVDRRGVGRDTSYVTEDPRVFYLVVESANLQWSFTVEEAVFDGGTTVEGTH